MLNNQNFKKSLILIWFIWWFIALWTDVMGGLAHLHVISADWAPDLNYPNLVSSLSMYHFPSWVPAMLYLTILLGLLLSTGLFAFSVIALRQPQKIWFARARKAFIFSLWFWLAFIIADQIVMKFDLEENHMVQAGFEFLSFLSFYLLPDED